MLLAGFTNPCLSDFLGRSKMADLVDVCQILSSLHPILGQPGLPIVLFLAWPLWSNHRAMLHTSSTSNNSTILLDSTLGNWSVVLPLKQSSFLYQVLGCFAHTFLVAVICHLCSVSSSFPGRTPSQGLQRPSPQSSTISASAASYDVKDQSKILKGVTPFSLDNGCQVSHFVQEIRQRIMFQTKLFSVAKFPFSKCEKFIDTRKYNTSKSEIFLAKKQSAHAH